MILYVALLVIGLIILGDHYPKIALAIAALILLGTITLNPDLFNSLMERPGGGGRA